ERDIRIYESDWMQYYLNGSAQLEVDQFINSSAPVYGAKGSAQL
ncbi:9873_t:CDS:1, partial [Scutellospora calospora]